MEISETEYNELQECKEFKEKNEQRLSDLQKFYEEHKPIGDDDLKNYLEAKHRKAAEARAKQEKVVQGFI